MNALSDFDTAPFELSYNCINIKDFIHSFFELKDQFDIISNNSLHYIFRNDGISIFYFSTITRITVNFEFTHYPI